MKHGLMATAAGVFLALTGCAQPHGMRSGMMGGAEGAGGRAMGPGMMRGAGAQPHGHGHGHGGYAMHPDMMAGPGKGGAMMGAMGGDVPDIPGLTDEQRARIAQIQQEFHARQWALMGQMHQQGRQPGGAALQGGQFDEQAARQAYDQMAAVRKEMFENSLEARKRISSVLTPQQREQWNLRSGAR